MHVSKETFKKDIILLKNNIITLFFLQKDMSKYYKN